MYRYCSWAIIRSGIITLQTPQTRSFWVWNSRLKQHFWGKTRHKDLSSFSHAILDILDFFLVACCYKCVHRQRVDLPLLALITGSLHISIYCPLEVTLCKTSYSKRPWEIAVGTRAFLSPAHCFQVKAVHLFGGLKTVKFEQQEPKVLPCYKHLQGC